MKLFSVRVDKIVTRYLEDFAFDFEETDRMKIKRFLGEVKNFEIKTHYLKCCGALGNA